MYSTLIYPETTNGAYTRPDLPNGYISFAFSSSSWNPYSTNAADRTEFWTNDSGEYTLEQATAMAKVNVSAEQNKAVAKDLLTKTDWVELPSVTNTNNTPHLMNVDAFLTYRVALRAITINAAAGAIVFPVIPTAQWSS